MNKFNEEDWPIIGDDYESLIKEGMRLANEIYHLLDGVTKRLNSEFTGP